MSDQLEVEKLTALDKEIGLAGKDLLEFVKDERQHLKKQRDIERAGRAEERKRSKKSVMLNAHMKLQCRKNAFSLNRKRLY